jgi:hypothetical protein
MHQVCFCGWGGEIADCEPSYLGNGEWGLTCPNCGLLDRLDWMPAAARDALITEARCRRAEHATDDLAALPAASLLDERSSLPALPLAPLPPLGHPAHASAPEPA